MYLFNKVEIRIKLTFDFNTKMLYPTTSEYRNGVKLYNFGDRDGNTYTFKDSIIAKKIINEWNNKNMASSDDDEHIGKIFNTQINYISK